MWSNLWAKSCDIFAHMVLPLEIATTEMCVYSDDVVLRASCNFNDPAKTKKAFKDIRAFRGHAIRFQRFGWGVGTCPSSVRGFEEPSVVWLETWRCLVRTAASCQIVSRHDEGCRASVWRLERSSSLGGSRLAHGGFIFHSCHFSFWEHEAHAGTWKTTDWEGNKMACISTGLGF
jgi:hypothetical protein